MSLMSTRRQAKRRPVRELLEEFEECSGFKNGKGTPMKRFIFLLAVMAPLVFVSGHGDNRAGAASAQSTPTYELLCQQR